MPCGFGVDPCGFISVIECKAAKGAPHSIIAEHKKTFPQTANLCKVLFIYFGTNFVVLILFYKVTIFFDNLDTATLLGLSPQGHHPKALLPFLGSAHSTLIGPLPQATPTNLPGGANDPQLHPTFSY